MKSGIELIAEERQEQITKHGYTIEEDSGYTEGELIQAAMFSIDPVRYAWPTGWQDHFRKKIWRKSKVDRLKVAGAFIAAEIDRLQNNNHE